jgi:molybdopterin-guanine dinucleotide biosynthesis protein A
VVGCESVRQSCSSRNVSSRFSAVLLAGGKSRRMGRDKAFVEIDGVPLWQRQLRTLHQLGLSEIFLAAPRRDEWNNAPCTIITDAQEDSGPLGGIVAALERSSSPLLLALAVDVPNITGDYLLHLVELCEDDRGVVPRTDRYEPLVALYPRRSLALAERLLVEGSYSLQTFADRCIADGMAVEHRVPAADASLFLNMNTPAELAAVADE